MRQGRWTFNRARKVYEPSVLEEHVVREIVDRLWLQARIKMFRVRERQFDAEKYRKTGRWQNLSTPGIPDLIGWCSLKIDVMNGHILATTPLFIECKRPHVNVHRPAQERFIEEAREGGCVAFFAESWGDVVRELGKVGVALQS